MVWWPRLADSRTLSFLSRFCSKSRKNGPTHKNTDLILGCLPLRGPVRDCGDFSRQASGFFQQVKTQQGLGFRV